MKKISSWIFYRLMIMFAVFLFNCNPLQQEEVDDELPESYTRWIELGPAPIGSNNCTGNKEILTDLLT